MIMDRLSFPWTVPHAWDRSKKFPGSEAFYLTAEPGVLGKVLNQRVAGLLEYLSLTFCCSFEPVRSVRFWHCGPCQIGQCWKTFFRMFS